MSDRLADLTYERYADASGEFMDPAKVEADIALLISGTDEVVTFADRAIAHDEQGGPKLGSPMTYDKIDSAIKVVEETAKLGK